MSPGVVRVPALASARRPARPARRRGRVEQLLRARRQAEPGAGERQAARRAGRRLDLLDRRVLQPARGRQLAHRGRHGAAELAVEVPLHHPPGRLPAPGAGLRGRAGRRTSARPARRARSPSRPDRRRGRLVPAALEALGGRTQLGDPTAHDPRHDRVPFLARQAEPGRAERRQDDVGRARAGEQQLQHPPRRIRPPPVGGLHQPGGDPDGLWRQRPHRARGQLPERGHDRVCERQQLGDGGELGRGLGRRRVSPPAGRRARVAPPATSARRPTGRRRPPACRGRGPPPRACAPGRARGPTRRCRAAAGAWRARGGAAPAGSRRPAPEAPRSAGRGRGAASAGAAAATGPGGRGRVQELVGGTALRQAVEDGHDLEQLGVAAPLRGRW